MPEPIATPTVLDDRQSELAIDALVVATAIRFGGGVVLTHVPDDLTRLAAGHPGIAIAAI